MELIFTNIEGRGLELHLSGKVFPIFDFTPESIIDQAGLTKESNSYEIKCLQELYAAVEVLKALPTGHAAAPILGQGLELFLCPRHLCMLTIIYAMGDGSHTSRHVEYNPSTEWDELVRSALEEVRKQEAVLAAELVLVAPGVRPRMCKAFQPSEWAGK